MDEPNHIFHNASSKNLKKNHVVDSNIQDGTVLPISENGETALASSLPEKSETEKQPSYGLPVLGAALASSAIFGFPVFCLICPIGLIFASLFALTRLLNFNEPTLDLIIFPIILVVELVFLRKWCSKICPLGALLSLFSRFNRRLVPTVDRTVCIEETKGIKCQQCRKACSFDIELKHNAGTGHISNCTKCKECSTSCPVHAISFPWKKTDSSNAVQEQERTL
jgi:ferredoxin-type protein NapH